MLNIVLLKKLYDIENSLISPHMTHPFVLSVLFILFFEPQAENNAFLRMPSYMWTRP